MPTPTDPSSIDDLRQRLRALGYLDAGVDRFVLASASRARRPAAIAWSASVRIGILAAVLLGPAAAIGLVTRAPGLITGPRDAAVAATYLGILFGTSVAAVSFVAALVAASMTAHTSATGSRLARRARLLSIGAGTCISAACLAYLTLWWRSATAEPGWAVTAFALAVAAAISLLLGHAVTVTALAVTMARPGEAVVPGRVPGGTWKASFGGTAIAFLGAVVLLLATAGESPSHTAAPPLTVSSSGARVIVLAIDGFDPQLHARLRSTPAGSGSDPLFAAFDTARATLAPSDTTDPARLWTTIATGVQPERHGVDALETRRVAGLQGRLGTGSTGRVLGAATDALRLTRPAIASNFERRVKTFWEVAEQAGLRTGVVNWWATWPAPASGGSLISDRAVLRLERGGALDAEIAPSALYDHLNAQWPAIRAAAARAAHDRFANGGGVAPSLPADLQPVLARSAELDSSMIQLADAVAARSSLDLLVVYLPGLDVAQQALLGGEASAPAPSELDVRLGALQRYYEFLHGLTRGLLAGSADRRIFVITQPGRLHRGPGILAAAGRDLQSATPAAGTIVDVAPTILHALGVPIARDLDGHVIHGLFRQDALAQHPVREVESYGLRGPVAAIRSGAPLDQEMIDRLRSLGYVR